ncbi:MAG TPA: MerC domain-containing protein [Puia sp.]|uniref:MerC domain-containing protein n=1 Tax=Puia sp. TaxID=2045100 RepID=UPI002D0C999E|nr:MerC domain-containing protein [Puia sp.]HVU94686.1 MerC domain-containing protein [Puia sp.]
MRVIKKSSYRWRWDAIGISASMVCAVHCVALPLLVSSLPFLGIELLSNKVFEAVMIGTSLAVGSWALSTGYRRRRRYGWPVALFAMGMFFLLYSTLWTIPKNEEIVFKALAAASIITAHAFNWKYGRNCEIGPAHTQNAKHDHQ